MTQPFRKSSQIKYKKNLQTFTAKDAKAVEQTPSRVISITELSPEGTSRLAKSSTYNYPR